MKKYLNKKYIIIGIILVLLPIIIEMFMFDNIKLDITKISILRIGYIYFIYTLIVIYKILDNKFTDKLKKLFDFILKYRYLIGLILFIIMVLFKLNISSIGSWKYFIPTEGNTTIIGNARPIRSDEWLVNSSFALGQTMNKGNFYPLINKNIRPDEGQNMLLVNSPVADITIIGKLHNVGFMLLGRDYGFAWHWSMRLILLILLSIEIAMILSKKDSFISIIGGIWIVFSPCVMWWFSATADLYIYSFAIIVLFYYYMRNTHWEVWKKSLIGLGMVSSISGLVFCFYPPLQVPMGFLILAFIIPEFIKKRKKLKKLDYLIMSTSFILSLGLVYYFYQVSKDAIELIMNTTYPGKRDVRGGDLSVAYVLNKYISVFTPFTAKNLHNISNESAVSDYIYPLIALIIVIISYFKNFKEKIKDKGNMLLISLIIFCVLSLIWCFIGFNETLSKITMLYMCHSKRVYMILSLVGLLLSILFISKPYINKRNIGKSESTIISILTVFISYIAIKTFGYDIYLNNTMIYVLIPIIFSITYFFLQGNKKAFLYIIFIITIFTGMTVNPIEYGTGAIYNRESSKKIQEIHKEYDSALWIGGSNVQAQYLIANGVKTLNGINFYPNFNWLTKIDEEGIYEEIYNRYAHISVLLGYEINFELVSADSYIVTLTYDKVKELGIEYFLTCNNLDLQIIKDFNLELLFENSFENVSIYKIN